MAGPYSSQGAILQVSISTVYTTIRKRTSIKPHKRKRAKIETTDLDATDETSIPGIRRGDVLECTINYDPALTEHAYLYASYQAGTASEAFKYILSNGSYYPFAGWVMEWDDGEAKTDQLHTVTFQIQCTGNTTLTP